MSFEAPGGDAPEVLPCRYGTSKLLFRGPRRDLDRPYVAFIGGCETFGRFVANPYPALVESGLGKVCVNLGSVNAGLDSFVHDAEVIRIARGAVATVVQVPGAHNMSNRFYRVHPRRNDRFLTASQLMSVVYREVDFTEFNFNRHMLESLQLLSPDRFCLILDELQQAWLARMRLFLGMIGSGVQLLWLRYPADTDKTLGPDPLFVDRTMLQALQAEGYGHMEIAVQPAGESGEIGNMVYGAFQEPAAEHVIGPAVHRDIAGQVLEFLKSTL